jgi:(p)ppGpp synthase/HD superfamily hydrolase
MKNTDISNRLINNALILACKVHKDQTRKGTDTPYIVHPFEVALILQENGADEEMIAAGLLHDVLEDGKEDMEFLKNEIREKLNERVLQYVIGASEKLECRSETPWKDRKDHTINYLKDNDTPIKIKMIACADKLSNARSIMRDYKVQGEKLWGRFNAGFESQKWYYTSLVDSLKELEGMKMYEEFKEIVNTIFNRE